MNTTDESDHEFIAVPCEGLREAYPGGIPETDLFPIIDALVELGFSNRNVAHILGLYFGVEYTEFLHEVAAVYPNARIAADDRSRVRAKLRKHGYEEWRRLV